MRWRWNGPRLAAAVVAAGVVCGGDVRIAAAFAGVTAVLRRWILPIFGSKASSRGHAPRSADAADHAAVIIVIEIIAVAVAVAIVKVRFTLGHERVQRRVVVG